METWGDWINCPRPLTSKVEPTQAISISMCSVSMQLLFASVFNVCEPVALISPGSLQGKQNPGPHSRLDEQEKWIIFSFMNVVWVHMCGEVHTCSQVYACRSCRRAWGLVYHTLSKYFRQGLIELRNMFWSGLAWAVNSQVPTISVIQCWGWKHHSFVQLFTWFLWIQICIIMGANGDPRGTLNSRVYASWQEPQVIHK